MQQSPGRRGSSSNTKNFQSVGVVIEDIIVVFVRHCNESTSRPNKPIPRPHTLFVWTLCKGHLPFRPCYSKRYLYMWCFYHNAGHVSLVCRACRSLAKLDEVETTFLWYTQHIIHALKDDLVYQYYSPSNDSIITKYCVGKKAPCCNFSQADIPAFAWRDSGKPQWRRRRESRSLGRNIRKAEWGR